MIAPIDLTSDTDSDDDDVVVIMQPPNDDDEVVIEPPNAIADAVAVVELPMVVPVLKRSIHGRCVGNPIPMVQRRLSPSGFYYNPIILLPCRHKTNSRHCHSRTFHAFLIALQQYIRRFDNNHVTKQPIIL